MDKSEYRSTFKQVKLSEAQKKRILNELSITNESISKNTDGSRTPLLQTMQKKLPRYVAAILCVLILTNLTVYAAKSFGLSGYFHDFYTDFLRTESSFTDEQMALINKYGVEMNEDITLPHGTLTINGILYDSSYLYLMYTYRSDEHIYCVPSLDILFNDTDGYGMSHSSDAKNYVEHEKGHYMTGYYLLNPSFQATFLPGDRFVFSHPSGDRKVSFTFPDSLEYLSVSALKEPFLIQNDLSIDQVLISPFSMTIYSHTPDSTLIYPNYIRQITYTLKDGSTNSFRYTGGSGSEEQTIDCYIFHAPCDPASIVSITVTVKDTTITIPLNE